MKGGSQCTTFPSISVNLPCHKCLYHVPLRPKPNQNAIPQRGFDFILKIINHRQKYIYDRLFLNFWQVEIKITEQKTPDYLHT